MARILIADDHPLFLAGLRSFLASAGHETISFARDAAKALPAIERSAPDLMIVGVSMPENGGPRLLRDLRQGGSAIPIIFLTVGMERRRAIEAIEHGVNGIVLKTSDPDALRTCIDAVLAGDSWFDRSLFAPADDHDPAAASLAGLTDRERQVASLVGEGLSNREIAERLALGEGTVKTHLNRIFHKLDIASRSQLILRVHQMA